MPQRQLTGSRIRERRLRQGIRQAELARKAGISASYLNLIEHNRRRIGGKLLLSLADVLDVEPSALTEGAEAAIIATLGEARAADKVVAAQTEAPEEFAGRYPGWAELLVRRHRRVLELERTVETLTDRLTHDPHLAAAMHDVLSTVTAIRSTAGILAETPELEPEWRDRFHRNINEDAKRLAESSQALVTYLDEDSGEETGLASPQDELEAFLTDAEYHFADLETAGADKVDTILESAEMLQSAAGRSFARQYLERYCDDAERMPLVDTIAALRSLGTDPAVLARHFGVSVARAMRRMAELPPTDGVPQMGLVSCDASGTLIFRKSAEGFALPRFGAACPKWPLFLALSRPLLPVRRVVQQDMHGRSAFLAYAIAEPVTEPDFGQDPLFQAHMLLVSLGPTDWKPEEVRGLGVGCRICPRTDCAGRREPSILTDGF
ncbi:transcriptional regulator, y4mF family [Thalassovita gelatinovora]|uniref:Transcriptional regulator, y4mF family n=1 Tax=Thalassovita gelatinovora TaxID=53501 RepID=A0A0P1G424_THAGE|nr:helix-turn-helix transcriptional regulator [Thalassovita gelatinovora]QIZ79899.1 DUF2083 domain-containing protein [Thalassovita gelatinovora]CUH67020.1 transcriptional regulator, y4mF family [Thalassovita gelatinovora]SEQ47124.1 hypothetical protein SAMN04488043_105321 [Thalassovita gelatinovora]